MSRLPSLRPALKDISIYETKAKFFLVGYNDVAETYQILELNRPVMSAEEAVSVRQDPHAYTRETLDSRLTLLKQHFPGLELVASGVCCLWGFVKLLESHYLIYVTKKKKVANIMGHDVFTIEKTQMLAITYKAKSSTLETKYKTILNANDLSKFFYFSYGYDLTKSYQRNVTEERAAHVTAQDMFAWNSYALKPLTTLINSHTDDALAQVASAWVVPVIHGFLDQRSFRFSCGSVLHFTLIARRSRYFAGTRYLRRGTNGEGHVANEVESEQLFTHSGGENNMIGSNGGRGSSLIQCRGSVPLFWSHVNLYSPKPDFRLEEGDVDLEASKAHFQSLFDRYGRRIQCFNLVRQSPHKEELLGTAFRELCPAVGRAMGPTQCYGHLQDEKITKKCEKCGDCKLSGGSAISYAEYDFLKNAHNKPGEPSHLFSDLEEKSEEFFDMFGFYVDPPFGSDQYLSFPCVDTGAVSSEQFRKEMGKKGSMCNRLSVDEARLLMAPADIDDTDEADLLTGSRHGDNSSDSNQDAQNSSLSYGAGSPTGMLQYGVLRTNCVDCLDRTNVAQFCYARVAISRQIKALGFLPAARALGDIVTSCMKVWAEHGDAIATQYGGSGAMHKVDAEGGGAMSSSGTGNADSEQSQDTVFVLTGGAKNALVAAKRYYSNVLSDYERQNSIDMLLGIFKPHYKDKHIWELKLRPEHLRHGKYGRRSSDMTPIAAVLQEEDPQSLLKQMSKNHFDDDDVSTGGSASSAGEEDEKSEDENKEIEILSSISRSKNMPSDVNIIRLAITSGSISRNVEAPFCELTSFDSTLHQEYDTLALDNLPFLPFPAAESDWMPSVYEKCVFIESAKCQDQAKQPRVFKHMKEKVYDAYLEYFSGGALDGSSDDFPKLLRAVQAEAATNTHSHPLMALSTPKSQLLSLLALTPEEKSLLQNSGQSIDPQLLKAFRDICPPNESLAGKTGAEAGSTAKNATYTGNKTDISTAALLINNDGAEKWEEKQKLREIFEPFGLASFPNVNDAASTTTDLEILRRNSEAENSTDGRSAYGAEEDNENSALSARIGESSVSGKNDGEQSIRLSVIDMLKGGDSKKNNSSGSNDGKKLKWQFWSTDKKKVHLNETSNGSKPPTATTSIAAASAVSVSSPTTSVPAVEKAIPLRTEPIEDVKTVSKALKPVPPAKPPQKAAAPSHSVAESASKERVENEDLREKMEKYELENLKLKMALQCMQRKIDDLCVVGFAQDGTSMS